MRKKFLIIPLLLIGLVSCVEKDPSWVISWGGEDPTPVQPPAKPQSDTDTTSGSIPKDVKILEAFTQDFKTGNVPPMSFKLRQNGSDMRYFSAFPSFTETDTDILLLRLDPKDKASDCPRVSASDYAFYGSCSVRVRTPDLSRIKQTTDTQFEMCLIGNDKDAGVSEIGIRWTLSNPAKMTVTSQSGTKTSKIGNSVAVQTPSGCDPSQKFVTVGWDWTPDCLKWWILDTGTKKILKEITAKGEIPALPGILSIGVFHTSDAPEYPFEIEIDKISYEPDQEQIQAWRKQ